MKVIKIDGVECYVFLEAHKLGKGLVLNVVTPVDSKAKKPQREYVNYRNGFIAGDGDDEAARAKARSMYEKLTAKDVREYLEAAKKLVP